MFQNFTLEEYDLLVITFICDCLSCCPCVRVSGVDKAECFSDIMTMHCYGASGILQMSVELCWTNLCLKGQQIWSGYNITCIFSSARYGLSASSDLSQYIGPTKERKSSKPPVLITLKEIYCVSFQLWSILWQVLKARFLLYKVVGAMYILFRWSNDRNYWTRSSNGEFWYMYISVVILIQQAKATGIVDLCF